MGQFGWDSIDPGTGSGDRERQWGFDVINQIPRRSKSSLGTGSLFFRRGAKVSLAWMGGRRSFALPARAGFSNP